DKPISKAAIEKIIGSGTDAIMISGTQNITSKNVSNLISLLSDYDIPKILEPVKPEAIIYEGVDYIFVPTVLNTKDLEWLIEKHVRWIRDYEIYWDVVVPEAYIVLNPDSAVAKLTRAKTDISIESIVAYGIYAEKYLRIPIVYVEYSGAYGNPAVVKSLKEALDNAFLFYGGGIDSRDKAEEMKKYADVIVVGNVVYHSLEKFLETIP
ncbi:MAG: geranylgeranylglyceryl/heptaprenylglyceryl phosphate synthase, partial [Candidatus Methanospirareceae archaeon]